MFALNILLYLLAFTFIWLGAGFIISSTNQLSKKLRLSSFIFSFVFLGLLTSIPEFSVGLQSVADNNPQIFIGNLLGGILVLFLVIIPLLAILGNGVSLKHELSQKTLLLTLFTILAPALFILDQKVTSFEGILLIGIYLIMLYLVQRNGGIFDPENTQLLSAKAYSYKDILKIFLGIGMVFLSSNLIVEKTIYFADYFSISPFYISLFIVALGTDLPEITLAIRSVISRKKEVAMGDYLGAAAASTILFGIFTVLNNGEIITINNFLTTFIFIFVALTLFYFFSRTKKLISRQQGYLLMACYLIFLVVEMLSR